MTCPTCKDDLKPCFCDFKAAEQEDQRRAKDRRTEALLALLRAADEGPRHRLSPVKELR